MLETLSPRQPFLGVEEVMPGAVEPSMGMLTSVVAVGGVALAAQVAGIRSSRL